MSLIGKLLYKRIENFIFLIDSGILRIVYAVKSIRYSRYLVEKNSPNELF